MGSISRETDGDTGCKPWGSDQESQVAGVRASGKIEGVMLCGLRLLKSCDVLSVGMSFN